jgi:hypothetical protein
LTQEEQLVISKFSPFRTTRNELLRELKSLGFTIGELVELSGLTKSAVGRVVRKDKLGKHD